MDSVSGTRYVVRASERIYWQARLFDHLARWSTFRECKNELLSLWQEACPSIHPAEAARWDVEGLHRVARSNAQASALATYLSALDRAVAQRLGLRSQGRPAPWARRRLHAEINPSAVLIPPYMVPVNARFKTVQIKVSANGATVDIDDHPFDTLGSPRQLANAGWGFDAWDDLQKAATSAANEAVVQLRRWYEEVHDHQYASKHPMRERDCERLAFVVTGRSQISDEADRRRLARAASRAGIDPPARRNRANSNP